MVTAAFKACETPAPKGAHRTTGDHGRATKHSPHTPENAPAGQARGASGDAGSGDHARQRSARRYLDDFIARSFPDAAVLYTVVGGVPCAMCPPGGSIVSSGT